MATMICGGQVCDHTCRFIETIRKVQPGAVDGLGHGVAPFKLLAQPEGPLRFGAGLSIGPAAALKTS
jgi:hypothetical protein